MFVTLSQIEKILVEKKKCTAAQFRARTTKKRWCPESYLSCYKAVLDHFDIVDAKGEYATSIARFLRRASEEKALDPGIDIGPKRRHFDYSYAESEDEGGDIHDVSMDTVMSLDESAETVELKRLVIQLRVELKGSFVLN